MLQTVSALLVGQVPSLQDGSHLCRLKASGDTRTWKMHAASDTIVGFPSQCLGHFNGDSGINPI